MKSWTQTALSLLACLLADESVQSSALIKHRQDLQSKASLITLPLSTGAACLDGSPYAFSIQGGSSKYWTIIFNGGAECSNETECEDRSRSASGSSTFLGEKLDDQCNCLNHDENGRKLKCTCVILLYCDGGFFLGYRDDPFLTSNGTQLMIRGRRNLEATIDALLENHGLANASDLVITGTSSGGLATFLNLDSMATRMPPELKVHGVPRSGFTINHKTLDDEDYYLDRMSMVFDFHNTRQALSSDCLAKHQAWPWLCMVTSRAAHFIKTPFFVMNSKHDAWQLTTILGLDRQAIYKDRAGAGELLLSVRDYGYDFMEEFKPLMADIIQNGRPHGAFIQTCICHADCNPTEQFFQGTSIVKHLGRWFRDHESAFYIEQDDPNYNCQKA